VGRASALEVLGDPSGRWRPGGPASPLTAARWALLEPGGGFGYRALFDLWPKQW